MIGHELQGGGSRGVVVLNDWMCDTSTWNDTRPYLDDARLTWAFADLRGEGESAGEVITERVTRVRAHAI